MKISPAKKKYVTLHMIPYTRGKKRECKINGENVGGSEHTKVGNDRLSGGSPRTIAVHGHAPEDIQERDLSAEMIANSLAGICHELYEEASCNPFPIIHNPMYLTFPHLAGNATDGYILEGAAESPHSMSFRGNIFIAWL